MEDTRNGCIKVLFEHGFSGRSARSMTLMLMQQASACHPRPRIAATNCNEVGLKTHAILRAARMTTMVTTCFRLAWIKRHFWCDYRMWGRVVFFRKSVFRLYRLDTCLGLHDFARGGD
jgi:hypothetical protein